MIKKNIFYVCLLLVGLCGITSCDDDPWDDDRPDETTLDDDPCDDDRPDETTLLLCDNIWEDFFITDDGAECRQTFEFRLNGIGVERREYMYQGHPDGYETYEFRWEWDYESPHSIRMEYGGGDLSYFDEIIVTPNLLTGSLDDEAVTFNAVRYKSSTQQSLKVRNLRVR